MAPPTAKKRVDYANDSKEFDGDFFQFPPLMLSTFAVVMFIFYWFVCYDIDAIPLHAMGPFGKFVLYLANNHLKALRIGFRFALMIHFLEAGFAYRICRRMMFSRVTSCKWLLQTALVGFPSLGLLLRHRKERELAENKRR